MLRQSPHTLLELCALRRVSRRDACPLPVQLHSATCPKHTHAGKRRPLPTRAASRPVQAYTEYTECRGRATACPAVVLHSRRRGPPRPKRPSFVRTVGSPCIVGSPPRKPCVMRSGCVRANETFCFRKRTSPTLGYFWRGRGDHARGENLCLEVCRESAAGSTERTTRATEQRGGGHGVAGAGRYSAGRARLFAGSPRGPLARWTGAPAGPRQFLTRGHV